MSSGSGGGFGGLGLGGSGGGSGGAGVGPDPNQFQPGANSPTGQTAGGPTVSVNVTQAPSAAAPAPPTPTSTAMPTPAPAPASSPARPGQTVYYVERSPPTTPRSSDAGSDGETADAREELPRLLNALINGAYFSDHPAAEHIDTAIGRVAEQSPEWDQLDAYVRDVANIAACRLRD
jgi:hypothetical protein